MKNIIFEKINSDYEFINSLRSKTKDKSDLWEQRLFKWISKLVTSNKIDPDKISKFRATSALLSEVPRNPYSNTVILKRIYKFLRFSGYKKTCFHNYEKLRDEPGLMWDNFNDIGNPLYFESDGKKFNERFLRHLRTTNLVEKHIDLKKDAIIVDIGGGYGQFLTMLNSKNPFASKILVDFPEQLLIASYYIRKTYPDAKINMIKDCYEDNFCIKKMVTKNDFLLIPTDKVFLLNELKVDLVCNFSSLGEMSKENFLSYMTSPLIKNTKYFFTINRLDSFPTYSNNISILDYDLKRFKTIHHDTSPIWDYYFSSFSPFLIRKHAFKSRNFEFIGKNS
jgi:putative sugar O-methyltransferase